MKKKFNITGSCEPKRNYMVNISKKLDKIERMIDEEEYFTINRARQFGKTTTLTALRDRLKDKYLVIRISFEGSDDAYYKTNTEFVDAFEKKVFMYMKSQHMEKSIIDAWINAGGIDKTFLELSNKIAVFCEENEKEVILLIDEVDKSSNNQFFLDFLGVLRNLYLGRSDGIVTFKSVILAGVYDVKNLKLKLRPEEESKYNSPWNIAAEFDIDMSFSVEEIQTMLDDYEKDHHIGFDTRKVSQIIYDYTSGYPFLVSYICKSIDEKLCETYGYENLEKAWTYEGVMHAIKITQENENLLYDDINKKLDEYKELNAIIKDILLEGNEYEYAIGDQILEKGKMFGLLSNRNGKVVVSNRIFEVFLYKKYISENNTKGKMSQLAKSARNYREEYVKNGELNMEQILKNFQKHFLQCYKDEYDKDDKKFIEDNGRFLFLTFIRPIINGDGNFYVEARTRNARRTDVVIDYNARQYIIKLKIWHGDEYNKRGEKQTFDYLSYYGIDKGYMVSFNFNKNKKCIYEEIEYNGKTIVEVVL